MSFRLYGGAWVRVVGVDQPLQVHRVPSNAGAFDVGGFAYDVDARPLKTPAEAPRILALLSLQAMREAGLRSEYGDLG